MSSELEFQRQYQLARAGDPGARAWLVERYAERLSSFVRARSGPNVHAREAPEDITQEALLTFLRRLADFPAELSQAEVEARLFQIAKWAIASVLERRRVVREASAAGAGSDYVLDPPTPSASRGSVTRADDRRKLGELIARLAPAHAQVVRCVVLEGRSIVETAQQCGLSEASVRKRLQRARAKLDEMATGWVAQEGEGPGEDS